MSRIGFWSALAVAATNLWFYAAFLPYSSLWNAPWPGMNAYAASFKPGPFLAWVIPSFLLPAFFLTMMVSVHRWSVGENRTWSLLAVVFAVAYAAVWMPFYYVLMTVVPYHLANGTTDGLSLLLFSYHYPHNIFAAVEGTGSGFLGISAIFAGVVFRSGRLQRWVRWTFIGLGVSVFALFINPLVMLPTALGLVAGLAGLLLGLLAPALLAVLFHKNPSDTTTLRSDALE